MQNDAKLSFETVRDKIFKSSFGSFPISFSLKLLLLKTYVENMENDARSSTHISSDGGGGTISGMSFHGSGSVYGKIAPSTIRSHTTHEGFRTYWVPFPSNECLVFRTRINDAFDAQIGHNLYMFFIESEGLQYFYGVFCPQSRQYVDFADFRSSHKIQSFYTPCGAIESILDKNISLLTPELPHQKESESLHGGISLVVSMIALGVSIGMGWLSISLFGIFISFLIILFSFSIVYTILGSLKERRDEVSIQNQKNERKAFTSSLAKQIEGEVDKCFKPYMDQTH